LRCGGLWTTRLQPVAFNGGGPGVIVVGLMSGTSMDGIDAAAAELELDREVLRLTPLGHDTAPYPEGLAAALRAALPPNPTSMEAVCRLDTAVGRAFAAAADAARARREAVAKSSSARPARSRTPRTP
jgi:1,6-anhydro-N-acetylmuramate kinase